jgi:hypothetical protein
LDDFLHLLSRERMERSLHPFVHSGVLMPATLTASADVLLYRRGLVFVADDRAEPLPERFLQAVELEWSALGYMPSARLRARLARLTTKGLAVVNGHVRERLAERLGSKHKHEPLFRTFPDGVPDDTGELWLRKVLSHFMQAEDQPCLFCRAVGTTHVLSPCHHVVCDRCFDGASYSACPICEHHVDRTSPFFQPSAERALSSKEKVTFKLLDVGERFEDDLRTLFVAFCERKQAMSPNDRKDLQTIVADIGATALAWLPEKIPVKENVALIFGTLFNVVDPAIVLPVAQRYFKTATDVLRFLAVYSGADASLLPQPRYAVIDSDVPTNRWFFKIGAALGFSVPTQRQRAWIQTKIRRFKMAKLRRPLRRALMELMESFPPDALVEDMLRHRSYWVWVGEFLHPHEHARRFPNVARAFAIVRKYAPDGTPAPRFAGFYSRLETTARARDADGMLRTLSDRPGELGRRLDHTLRVAGDDQAAVARVLDRFVAVTPRLSTPMLLTLRHLLPSRQSPMPERVYWPKGEVTSGFYAADQRAPLRPEVIARATTAATTELLRRFAEKPPLDDVLIDTSLAQIMVPFNERTASRSAVSLPRGSTVPVPRHKTVRMFLHWCQPEKGGHATDIDLSVGFYGEDWRELGVCSFYQLKLLDGAGGTVATSGGDMRDAPFPDGATELIDLDWQRALGHGIRYAVMVVNNYAGMPFSQLERGYAGLMLRDDVQGAHCDPRTVELKFDLQGDNGVYMPLVLDLQTGVLHWLDVYSTGELAFNTVASSRRAITKICPSLMRYFGSGVRASMFDLALLHAAARARHVYLRGDTLRKFESVGDEDAIAFLSRLCHGEGGERVSAPAWSRGPARALAVLYRGDLELPDGSSRYVLFPERVAATISASDLLT